LAELMGGRIGVDTAPNKGSTFWFTAVFARPANAGAERRYPAADLQGVRVLVVDDNPTNRLLVSTALGAAGCRVAEAPNGERAISMLHAAARGGDAYRVALLDARMPDIDSEDLARRIKADSQIRDTVLIVMTSLGWRGDARLCEAAGFAGYLTKPLRHRLLQDTVSLTLGGRTALPAIPTLVTRHTVSEARRSRKRVLVAEDNIVNQKVAIGLLGKLGYKAEVVANGCEVLKALADIPYDLVLMDCQMPEMDGYEATRRIRDPKSQVRNHKLPVVALTAHAMHGDHEQCLQAGMNDYLAKPISSKSLASVLDRWLLESADQENAPTER